MEELTAKELRDAIAAARVSSIEATQDVFERIDKYDSTIGAYICTFREQALDKAAETHTLCD